jgi:predicted dinucleotide-binding enzyme
MMVVMTPLVAVRVDVLMIEVVDATPFTDEVRVLTAEARRLALMKLAVVVAVLPFTTEVSVNELVDVETVSVFDVEDATRLVRSVVVATPFTVVVSVVPDVEISFDEMTVEVATTPLIVVVKILPASD